MLQFTEEQSMLRDSALRFAKEHYDFDTRRKRAQAPEENSLWPMMAELGWLLIPFAEDDGGLGGGLAELVGLYEAFGRGLVLEPFFSTVTLGGGFVRHATDAGRRQEILDGVMAGQRHVAAALYEPKRRFDLMAVDTVAQRSGGGFVLRGGKSLVLGGGLAEDLVVLARTAGQPGDADGRTLFLVPADLAGVQRHAYRLRDDHPACDINLDGVQIGPEAVIGEVDQASVVLDDVLSAARVCLAAEALGICTAATEATKAYLSTRTQFGRPIGTFQVLSHRLTDMYVKSEEVRSLVYRAASADGTDELSWLSIQAKLRANTAGLDVTKEAIQLHGGIGVTEELVIGHYFRRMTTLAMLFGDTAALRVKAAT